MFFATCQPASQRSSGGLQRLAGRRLASPWPGAGERPWAPPDHRTAKHAATSRAKRCLVASRWPGRAGAEGLGPGVGPAVGPPDLALNLTDLLDCSCYAENCHCKVWNCLRPTFVWRASFTLGILASLSSSSLFIIP